MIGEFARSWPLFHNAYLAGWLIAVLLAQTGVIIVARNQIFIGLAVAQASTLGIALGMWAGTWLGGAVAGAEHLHESLSAIAVLSAVAAALLTARAGSGSTHEAVTGWVYLAGASGATLVLAHSPHGLEEIAHLVSSSIIGATRADVWRFAGLVAVAVAFLAWGRDRIMLFAMDPAMAAAVGMRPARWAALVATWLGLVVGLAMRVTGLLFTVGNLVLPALAAATLCREMRAMIVVAPALALGTALLGFIIANATDDPPAQMTIALQSVLLLVVWLVRRRG